jgi:hypothetical protein
MRRALRCALVVALVLTPSAAIAADPPKTGDDDDRKRDVGRRFSTSQPVAGYGTNSRAPWIVAATPGTASETRARARGATILSRELGLFVLPQDKAAALVADLESIGRFNWSEPDVALRRTGLPADPLSGGQWWIPQLVPVDLTPPAPGPVIGIVDSGADTSLPDLSGGNITLQPGLPTASNAHGTAVTSAASAPANGVGIVGLYPGATTRMYPHGDTCSGATAGVLRAARDGVSVINMSYGLACFSHFIATEFAFGKGAVLVGAAGNSEPGSEELNYPADDPHVVTVGALNQDGTPAAFTQVRASLDVAVAGVGVPAQIPLANDVQDGVQDGYRLVDGTSISAPLVSAAVAWIRAARPNLTPSQVAELLRDTATDIAPAGFDRRTGFGMLNLKAALTARAPFPDPSEPNEDVIWVNGRHLPKQTPELRGVKSRSFIATLDYTEDPVDVVPVYMAPRSRLIVTAVPARRGNINLEVFNGAVKTVFYRVRPKTLLGSSYRRGPAKETVVVQNRAKRATIFYVAVFVPRSAQFSDATYRLTLRRTALAR